MESKTRSRYDSLWYATFFLFLFRYSSVPVEHNEINGDCFLLSQGIQRRVRLSLFYETGSELYWSKVNEIAIGQL